MSGMHTFGYARNDCKCWEYEVRTWKVLAVGSLTCNSNRLGGGGGAQAQVCSTLYLLVCQVIVTIGDWAVCCFVLYYTCDVC